MKRLTNEMTQEEQMTEFYKYSIKKVIDEVENVEALVWLDTFIKAMDLDNLHISNVEGN